jgi:thiol-disulfide isomerase/thioredoxin
MIVALALTLLAAPAAVCAPTASTSSVLRQLEDVQASCKTPACLDEQRMLLENSLAASPDDVFLQRARLEVLRGLLPQFPGELSDLYSRTGSPAALATPPASRALALYLEGLSARHEVRETKLKEALAADPSFVWPHLSLRTPEHLRAFLDACPESVEGLTAATQVDSEAGAERLALARGTAPRLRAWLETHPGELSGWPTLWAGEFATTPPASRDAVRARVAADLVRLQAHPQPDRLAYWEALIEGHKVTGDTAARRSAEGEEVTRFPCSDPVYFRRQEALEAQPRDDADRRAKYEQSTGWSKVCPGDARYALTRYQTATTVAELPPEELLDAADGFVASWGDFRARTPVPATKLARLYQRRGLRTDRIPALLKQAEEQIDAEYRSAKDWGGSRGDRADRTRAMNRFDLGALRAELALAGGQLDAARQALAAIRPGAEPRDIGEVYQRQRWHSLRALLAEKESRLLDAVVDLREASDGNKNTHAVELWSKLGGSQESFDTFWAGSVATRNSKPEEPPAGTAGAGVGKPFPVFSLTDTAGRTWTNQDLAGKVVVINAWATWCAPCREELPWLEKVQARVAAKPDVLFLSINVNETQGEVAPFAKEHHITAPVLLGGESFMTQHTEGIPTTWVLDRKGVVRLRSVGTSGEEWTKELEAAIAAAS